MVVRLGISRARSSSIPALGLVLFAFAVLTGTILDARARRTIVPRTGTLLVADLHVHPYPGDGSLTVAQVQREAVRRGVDVVAITGHNNRFGLRLSSRLGMEDNGVIVVPGQEVTSAGYHMVAAGIGRLIDWRLTAANAIEAVHADGGVAIAAHPIGLIDAGWDEAAQRTLDGTEVMHPLRRGYAKGGRELDAFFEGTRAVNPAVAPIGSTDFHMMAPLGSCRTYILAKARSAAATLEAIRDGRTAAACGDGEIRGAREHVASVRAALGSITTGAPPSAVEKLIALIALIGLGALAVPSRK